MKVNEDRRPFAQKKRKEKYNIKKDDVVVIEKNNIVNSIGSAVFTIIKVVLYAILLSLAVIGTISLIVPETREILILQAESVFDEFINLIGM